MTAASPVALRVSWPETSLITAGCGAVGAVGLLSSGRPRMLLSQ